MNYLAHVFLSYENEEILAGNLMADFIKGKPDPGFPDDIQNGIILHRMIDHFTDNHPVVIESKKILYPEFGKYAPVVIDVFFDHILAINWSRYHPESLEEFSERSYERIQTQMQWMPDRLKLRLPGMMDHNWLTGYRTLTGIARSFSNLERRVSRPDKIRGAISFLKGNIGRLDKSFNTFFPDVEDLAKGFIAEISLSN